MKQKLSLKLLLLELLLVVNWKWNKIQFEAIAPRAIAHNLKKGRAAALQFDDSTPWAITPFSELSLWAIAPNCHSWSCIAPFFELSPVMTWECNKIQFEAIAPFRAIAHNLKKPALQFEDIILRAIVLSYRSFFRAIAPGYCSFFFFFFLSYRSSWPESATKFSLKLSLLELSLVVNWKWNKIQCEAIAPRAIARRELKVKQNSVWSHRSLRYRSLSYRSLWTETWKCNKIQFEAIAPWAIAHCELNLKVKQNSVGSNHSLSYRSSWTKSATTFSLKLSLLELSLVVNWNLKVKQNSVWSYCSLSYRSSWTESKTKFRLKLSLQAIARCELKVQHYLVWSYHSLSYRSLWTESATTFSLKLSLLELSLITWKRGGYLPSVWRYHSSSYRSFFELSLRAIAPSYRSFLRAIALSYRSFFWAIAPSYRSKLSLLELSLLFSSYRSLSYRSLWTESATTFRTWSYRSLSYRSLWTESATTFSLKLSLLELSLITRKRGGLPPFSLKISLCELLFLFSSYRSELSILKLSLLFLELSLVVTWKCNQIQFEAIAPFRAIAHNLIKGGLPPFSLNIYQSLSNRSWSEKDIILPFKALCTGYWLLVRCQHWAY